MKLMTDSDLHDSIEHGRIVRNFSDTTKWESKGSQIQPTSLDLRIGEIYVPSNDAESTLEVESRSEYVLKSGFTAIVTTAEVLCLPANIAAIAFPPNHISMGGLLMTNAGHVDPGYEGKLRFTLINMGRKDCTLRAGDGVVTILFFRLDDRPVRDYSQRGNPAGGRPSTAEINRLAPHFVDLERQVTNISEAAASRATSSVTYLVAILAILITAVSAAFSVGGSMVVDHVQHLRELQKEVYNLESEVEGLKIQVNAKSPVSPSASALPTADQKQHTKTGGGR